MVSLKLADFVHQLSLHFHLNPVFNKKYTVINLCRLNLNIIPFIQKQALIGLLKVNDLQNSFQISFFLLNLFNFKQLFHISVFFAII